MEHIPSSPKIDMRAERLQLRQSLRDEEKKCQKLEGELKLAQIKVTKNSKKVKELKEMIQSKEELLEQERTRSQKLEKEKTELKSANEELEEEKNLMQKKLQRITERNQKYRNSFENSLSEKEKLRKVMEEERGKQSVLQKKMQRASSIEIKIEDNELQKENEDLRERIRKLENENLTMQLKTQDLERKVEELESTTKVSAHQRSRSEDIDQKARELTRKVEDLEHQKRLWKIQEERLTRSEEKMKEKAQRDQEIIDELNRKLSKMEKEIRDTLKEQQSKEQENMLKLQQEVLTPREKKNLVRRDSRLSTTARTEEKENRRPQEIEELLKIEGAERARVWEYHPDPNGKWDAGKWSSSQWVVKVERRAFGEGSLRVAHKLTNLGDADKKWVVKFSKNKSHNREIYENDIEMQTFCQRMAEKFNEKNPPKKVTYVPAYLIEMLDRPRSPVGHLESLLEGEFSKYNNNDGLILTARNTPQAFSHFTYEQSEKYLVIVDVQGVGDQYTDPQIHTSNYDGFGVGNLGQKGILKFLITHTCNPVCKAIGLTPVSTQTGSAPSKGIEIQLNGTMPKPDTSDWKFEDVITISSEEDSSKQEANSNSYTGSWNVIETIRGVRPDALAISSKYIFAPDDEKLKVFDRNTFELLHTLKGHTDTIESLCCNETHIFSGSADKDLRVWAQEEWKTVKTFDDHTGSIKALIVQGDLLVSAGTDKTVRLWDATLGSDVGRLLVGHTKPVKALALTPDSRLLFTGGNDNSIKVWNLQTSQVVFNFDGHQGWITSLSVFGRYLFSCGNDKTVKIWDIPNLMLVTTLSPHGRRDNINAVLATPRGLFSAADDTDIKIFAYPSLASSELPREHKGGVVSIAMHNDLLFSASFDGIKVWKYNGE